MSIPQLREVRVTRRESAGRHLNPHRTAVESGMARHARSNQTFPHREHVDPKTGFVWTVEDGRTAGLTVSPDTGNFVCATPTSTPNSEDKRNPTRQVNGVWVSGRGNSTRAVRTVELAEERLPSIVRKPAKADTPKRAKGSGTGGTRGKVAKREDKWADLREFAASHGIPLEKLADKRVRAAIREVIEFRGQVAAYGGK